MGKMTYTTKHVIDFLKQKGITTVDANWQYTDVFAKFKVVCSKGHEWKVCWHDLQRKNRRLVCHYCSGRKLTEDEARSVVESKGGQFDVGWKYVGAKSNIIVTCARGHKWMTCITKIRRGYWCPACGSKRCHDKKRHDVEFVRSEISKKGGLVEPAWKYKNAVTPFWLTCLECNNKWSTTWNRIQQGHWCPICDVHSRVKERMFRKFLQSVFGCDFLSQRPRWLINPKTQRRLELDGYDEGLRLAFEYQGIHHYELCGFNRFSPDLLRDQQERDGVKKLLCKAHDVVLIEVPYWISPSKWPSLIQSTVDLPISQKLLLENGA